MYLTTLDHLLTLIHLLKTIVKKVVDDHKSGKERDTASCFKIPLKNFLGASEDEDKRDGQTKSVIFRQNRRYY